jgi:hypothetical protein
VPAAHRARSRTDSRRRRAIDEAWVGDERATAQPGHFYGGWVTSKVVGPFKGEPGSFGW